MGRYEIHQPKAQTLHTRVGGNVKGMVNRTRRFDEGVERQMRSPCTIEGALSLQHIIDRLDLGQHDVAQAVTGLTNDGSHVVGKGGMIHRMHTRRHPGAGRSFAGQRSHQGCMLGLGTDRRSVFTIERHVKNAGAELLRHFSL